jgi:uncharacterized protein (TIGR00251 family)
MTIEIREHPGGCILSVRAQPGARRAALVGEHAGMLKVAVTAPPDKGKANEAIIEVLAESLGLKRSQIALVSGATSRQKEFLITGVSAKGLAAILERLMQ